MVATVSLEVWPTAIPLLERGQRGSAISRPISLSAAAAGTAEERRSLSQANVRTPYKSIHGAGPCVKSGCHSLAHAAIRVVWANCADAIQVQARRWAVRGVRVSHSLSLSHLHTRPSTALGRAQSQSLCHSRYHSLCHSLCHCPKSPHTALGCVWSPGKLSISLSLSLVVKGVVLDHLLPVGPCPAHAHCHCRRPALSPPLSISLC